MDNSEWLKDNGTRNKERKKELVLLIEKITESVILENWNDRK